MVQKKMVYVVTAFLKDYEELNYTSPSEDFCCDTKEEAQALKEELEQDPTYSDVYISDEKEEREVLSNGKGKEEL